MRKQKSLPAQAGFAPILIILIIAVIAVTGIFLVAKNTNINQTISIVTPVPKPTSTPILNITAPTSNTDNMQIIDGNIYKGNKIFINKDDYKDRGYYDFIYVSEASDKSGFFVFAQGSISIAYLLYSPLDKINLKLIDNTDDAFWSNNSNLIAYTNRPCDACGATRLSAYNVKNGQITNLVDLKKEPKISGLNYDYLTMSIVKWTDDDSGIVVDYSAFKEVSPYGGPSEEDSQVSKGNITIPLSQK